MCPSVSFRALVINISINLSVTLDKQLSVYASVHILCISYRIHANLSIIVFIFYNYPFIHRSCQQDITQTLDSVYMSHNAERTLCEIILNDGRRKPNTQTNRISVEEGCHKAKDMEEPNISV